MTTSDSEALIISMCSDVGGSPFAIAPERADELKYQVMGEPWSVRFEEGKANFTAFSDQQKMKATFAARLSLWAVARATVIIGSKAMAETRSGFTSLDTSPGTPVAEAIGMVDAARSLIRDPISKWPSHLPKPDSTAPQGSQDWDINNLFLDLPDGYSYTKSHTFLCITN